MQRKKGLVHNDKDETGSEGNQDEDRIIEAPREELTTSKGYNEQGSDLSVLEDKEILSEVGQEGFKCLESNADEKSFRRKGRRRNRFRSKSR